MNLTNRTKTRIGLAILFLTFELGIFVIKTISANLRLEPFTWVMLVFATSMGGSAIAYMAIGDFIRWPVTKEVPHSSSASMIEIEPKYDGWLKSLGMLFCCPVCVGTWVGASLLALMAVDYQFGYYTTVALSIGGAARLITRLTETIEWHSHLAQERTALLNRQNAKEEAEKGQPHHAEQADRGKSYWVIKDEEEVKPQP